VLLDVTRANEYKKNCKRVDVSSLNQVLLVDDVKNLTIVEPLVTMDILVKETLKYQRVPQVIPEFKVT
jgi:hypothetical protein